jgi:hypothetical protein
MSGERCDPREDNRKQSCSMHIFRRLVDCDTIRALEAALANLALRLTPEEMALIERDKFVKTNQREMRNHIEELG